MGVGVAACLGGKAPGAFTATPVYFKAQTTVPQGCRGDFGGLTDVTSDSVGGHTEKLVLSSLSRPLPVIVGRKSWGSAEALMLTSCSLPFHRASHAGT